MLLAVRPVRVDVMTARRMYASQKKPKKSWPNGGSAEWTDGDTAFLSVAFSWRLDDAYQRAVFVRVLGVTVARQEIARITAGSAP